MVTTATVSSSRGFHGMINPSYFDKYQADFPAVPVILPCISLPELVTNDNLVTNNNAGRRKLLTDINILVSVFKQHNIKFP
jgi:hypothetical protein